MKNITMVGSFVPTPTFFYKQAHKKRGVEVMVGNEIPLLAYTHNQNKGQGGELKLPFLFLFLYVCLFLEEAATGITIMVFFIVLPHYYIMRNITMVGSFIAMHVFLGNKHR
jgi:hypothetical protein